MQHFFSKTKIFDGEVMHLLFIFSADFINTKSRAGFHSDEIVRLLTFYCNKICKNRLTNSTVLVDWFETIHKMWSCSFWTLPHRESLKYFRLLAESAVDICRSFLYTVLVVSVFSQPQLITKKEIGNPFGKVYLFFRWGYFATAPCFCLYCAIFISHPPAAENRFSYSYYNRALL